jgi:hypothetical protein
MDGMVATDRSPADSAQNTRLSADLLGQATFICGHPKSGTSLVMTLLDSHPDLIVFPEETGYFRQFLPQTEALSVKDRLQRAEELIIGIFRWNARKPHPSQAGFPDRDYSDIDFKRVRRTFRELVSEGAAVDRATLPAAILAYGTVNGLLQGQVKRWVEKTPYNEHFEHPEWSEWTFARSWQRSLAAGLRNRRRYGADRYLILKYEELISRTDDALAEIVEHLGIQLAPTLWSPTRAGKPWGGNSMFDERFEGISSDPIGRYRQHLGTKSIRRLQWVLRSQMGEFGYSLENTSGLDRVIGWIIRGLFFLSPVRASLARFESMVKAEAVDQGQGA